MDTTTELSLGAIVAMMIIKEVLSFFKEKQGNPLIHERQRLDDAIDKLVQSRAVQTQILNNMQTQQQSLMESLQRLHERIK